MDGIHAPLGHGHFVTSKSSAQLRLHTERTDEQPGIETAELDSLCRAFETATGWELKHEKAAVGFGETWATPIDGGGRLVLRQADDARNTSRSRGQANPPPAEQRDSCPTSVR